MHKGFLRFLLVVGFFVLTIGTLTYPAVFNLDDKLVGDGGDNVQFFSWLQIINENAHKGRWLFADTNMWRFPIGFEFARGVDSYLFLLMGFGLNLVLNNAVLVFNLTILFLFVVGAYCAYLLFKEITRSDLLGVLGAVIYGFSFHALARNGNHPNLMFTGGFSLFGYAILRVWVDRLSTKFTKINLVLVGFSVLLIAMGSYQYLLMWLVLLVTATWMMLLIDPKVVAGYLKIFWQRKWFMGLLLVVYLGVMLVFGGYQYASAIIGDKFETRVQKQSELYWWSPSLLEYVRPHEYLRLWYTGYFPKGEKLSIDFSIFIGFVEISLFAWFVFSGVEAKKKIFVSGMFLVFWVLSLGMKSPDLGISLPYFWLHPIFPFWGVEEVGRWYTVFYLFVTAGILLVLARFKQKKYFVPLVIFILILVTVERWSGGFYLSEMKGLRGEFEGVVRNLPGTAVLDIPVDLTASHYASYTNSLAGYYGKKITNGYLHWSVDSDISRTFIDGSTLRRFACLSYHNVWRGYVSEQDIDLSRSTENNNLLVDRLKENDVREIVLHKDRSMSHLYFEECDNVLAEVTRLLPRVSVIGGALGRQELLGRRFDKGVVDYKLYFPRGGKLSLYGLNYSDPLGGVGLRILTKEGEVDLSEWQQKESFDNGQWTKWLNRDGEAFAMRVESGEVIQLLGDAYTEDGGFLNLWYEFEKDEALSNVPWGNQFGPVEKVFEDENEEVWLVR